MSGARAARGVQAAVALVAAGATRAADRVVAPAPSATDAPATPAKAPLICRSSVETGSLIARHKQCLTKAQWRYVDDAHEDETRKLMMDNMGRPSCNGPTC